MKEKDKLKDLMKIAGLESPSDGFTDMVMDQLVADQETVNDGLLPIIQDFKDELVPSPSMGFERDLFDQLKQKPRRRVEIDLIPKWIRWAIPGCILLVGIILFFFPAPATDDTLYGISLNFNFEFYQTFSNSAALQMLALSVVIGGVLFMFDELTQSGKRLSA